jgi:hypothetical protein
MSLIQKKPGMERSAALAQPSEHLAATGANNWREQPT